MRMTLKLETAAMEIKIVIEYTPADPGNHTLRTGDPGYPPEPSDVEYVGYTAIIHEDLLLPLPRGHADFILVMGVVGESSGDSLENRIIAWVERDAGHEAADAEFANNVLKYSDCED